MHAKTIREQRKELQTALKKHHKWETNYPTGAPPQAWHTETQELITYSMASGMWSSHRGRYHTAQEAIQDIETHQHERNTNMTRGDWTWT